MADNTLSEKQVEELDNSVPIFNEALGTFQYEDGTNFECEINSWDQVSRQTNFKGLSAQNDDEDGGE